MQKFTKKKDGLRKAINEYVCILDLKKKDYDSYYKISVLLNELGQKDDAIEMLKKLIKIKPLEDATRLLGTIYFEEKEFKKAVDVYASHLKQNPEDYGVCYNLGICYARTNDFESASKCFEKAIELNEDLYLAYYRLAQIALLYRDFEIAEEYFKKGLCNEKEAKSYLELAKIHIIKNQKETAILEINKALKIDSSLYEKVKREPMFFTIRKLIDVPIQTIKPEYIESEKEIEIDEYLRDTYNLTKNLNDKNNIIDKDET